MPRTPCPICNEPLEEFTISEYEWGIVESSKECESCSFIDNFAYGAYFVRVGEMAWSWSYCDAAPRTEINIAIKAATKAFKVRKVNDAAQSPRRK